MAAATQEGGGEAPSPEVLFAAWAAAPQESAEAEAAAAALRLGAAPLAVVPRGGWMPLWARALAALQDSQTSERYVDMLVSVVQAASRDAYSLHDDDFDVAHRALPPETYAEWLKALLPDHSDANASRRRAAARFFRGVQQPCRYPEVAAAAALELARTATLGDPDKVAVSTIGAFSLAMERREEGDEACARAMATAPGICEALLPLLAVTRSEEDGNVWFAFHFFVALCRWQGSIKQLLDQGIIEVCLANVASDSCHRASHALGVLSALLEGGGDAWAAMSAAGVCFHVLHAPTLLPGGARGSVASATLKFLHGAAAAAAAATRAQQAAAPTRPAASLTQAARHAYYHHRAAQAAASPTSFWTAVLRATAAAPNALAAMAYSHRYLHQTEGQGVLPLHCCCEYDPSVSGQGTLAALAFAALLQPSWPVAPLLAMGGAPLNAALATHHGEGTDDAKALYAMMTAWADDGTCTLLGIAVPPGPPRLSAAVSCALLAPYIPHLGSLLTQHAPERVPLLLDALLVEAAAIAADMADEDYEEPGSWDVESDSEYRFSVLCAALGELVAEAFPVHALRAAPETAQPSTHRGDNLRKWPRFTWRRAASVSPQQPAAAKSSGGSKRPRSDDAPAGSGGLLSAEDVDVPLRGCVRFLVGGCTVHAMGLSMERASPVLAEALRVADASGGASATEIPLPPMPDVSAEDHVTLFKAAVEHAYTGTVRALPSSLLTPLWRLAHGLAMAGLKAWCARMLTQQLRKQPMELFAALELAQSHCCADLEKACARGLLAFLASISDAVLPISAGATPSKQRHFAMRSRHMAAAALAGLAALRPEELRAALRAALTDALRELFGAPPAPPAAEAMQRQ